MTWMTRLIKITFSSTSHKALTWVSFKVLIDFVATREVVKKIWLTTLLKHTMAFQLISLSMYRDLTLDRIATRHNSVSIVDRSTWKQRVDLILIFLMGKVFSMHRQETKLAKPNARKTMIMLEDGLKENALPIWTCRAIATMNDHVRRIVIGCIFDSHKVAGSPQSMSRFLI